MDSTTLIEANLLFFLLYVIAIAVTGRSHGRIRGSGWFAWANALRGIVMSVLLFAGTNLWTPLDILANTATLIGFLSLHRAFAEVIREPRRMWRTQVAVTAVSCCVMVAISILHGPYRLFMASMSLGMTAILALTATMLLTSGEPGSADDHRSARGFTAILLLCYCVLNLYRAEESLRGTAEFGSPRLLELITIWLLASLIINGGTAFGFVLIASEQLSRQLKLKAQTDALTRLRNRHALPTVTASLDADRRIVTLSAISLDLDGMKLANDRFGHEFGDNILRQVAALLLDAVSRPDCAIRLGGDEFLLLLPNVGIDEAAAIAERIRSEIYGLRFEPHPEPGMIRASLGVIELASGPARWQNLLERADLAMYRAKQGGRDRVSTEDATTPWVRREAFDSGSQPT
jgi:diguanylate cyclase (GGDEF)-like protein